MGVVLLEQEEKQESPQNLTPSLRRFGSDPLVSGGSTSRLCSVVKRFPSP